MTSYNILGQIKTSTAIITDTNNKGVFLIADPSCEKESACHGCTMCSEPPPSGPKLFCPNTDSNNYKKNQIVTIKRFIPNEILAAVTVFGLPILCAIITFFLPFDTRKRPIDKEDEEEIEEVLRKNTRAVREDEVKSDSEDNDVLLKSDKKEL